MEDQVKNFLIFFEINYLKAIFAHFLETMPPHESQQIFEEIQHLQFINVTTPETFITFGCSSRNKLEYV